jgi:hypothetical protein
MEPDFVVRTLRRRAIACESSVLCSRTSERIACVLGYSYAAKPRPNESLQPNRLTASAELGVSQIDTFYHKPPCETHLRR